MGKWNAWHMPHCDLIPSMAKGRPFWYNPNPHAPKNSDGSVRGKDVSEVMECPFLSSLEPSTINQIGSEIKCP